MYPLWPYQDAWKPGTPDGTVDGGAIPGPTLEVHVSVSGAAVGDASAQLSPRSARLAIKIAATTTARRSPDALMRFPPIRMFLRSSPQSGSMKRMQQDCDQENA